MRFAHPLPADCHTRTARPDNKGKPYRSATAVIYPTDHGCAKERGVIAKEREGFGPVGPQSDHSMTVSFLSGAPSVRNGPGLPLLKTPPKSGRSAPLA